MNYFKHWLKKYDKWCEELGLTPSQKRSCVAYREEPTNKVKDIEHLKNKKQ
jgi:hypothetical protein